MSTAAYQNPDTRVGILKGNESTAETKTKEKYSRHKKQEAARLTPDIWSHLLQVNWVRNKHLLISLELLDDSIFFADNIRIITL